MSWIQLFQPKKLPLSRYERKITSPHGLIEEGVLEFIFSQIPPHHRVLVDMGAGNGTHHSLSRNLISHGWTGLLIEADSQLFKELSRTYESRLEIKLQAEPLTRENCALLLKNAMIPQDFDLLCIDIDGIDYYVWQALENYRPSIVCIEYNASFPPPQKFVVDYNPKFRWKGDDYHGASIQAYVELARVKGYELLHVTSEGDNLFFVRKEEFGRFQIGDNSPAKMYQIPQYGRKGRAKNGKGHPASPLTSSPWTRFIWKLRYWGLGPVRFFLHQLK